MTAKPLYRITKERWSPQYQYATGKYGERRCDKREVVITERRGRVTQTIQHAKRNNESVRRRWPDEIRGDLYRVYVEVTNDPVEFTSYAEEI